MKGFDSRFDNFPNYILGITHEIWEEKKVDTLNHYYSDDIPVRSPSSLVIGNKAVIKATLDTSHLNTSPSPRHISTYRMPSSA